MKKISELNDLQLARLIDNRWASSETVFDIVKRTYETNTRIYKNDPEWLKDLPRKRAKIRANRIFTDMEAVINSLIANPPQPNIIPTRNTAESKDLALTQESYFLKKYQDRNIKEVMRKGLRNLYFARLIVIKPFWDSRLNDFNAKAINPKDIRVGKNSTKEDESEFAIEEVTDNLEAALKKFPAKATDLMTKFGMSDEAELLINNPEIKYKEAWIKDRLICSYDGIILSNVKNPYWDWDGLMVTKGEEDQIADAATPQQRKTVFSNIRSQQEARKAQVIAKAQQLQADPNAPKPAQGEAPVASAVPKESPVPDKGETLPQTENQDQPQTFSAYYFNHFDEPRKPYIFATIFNNENTPVGQTDMITQAAPLQEGVDRRKIQIDENAELVNGQIKIDSAVMGKDDAQKLRFEPRGIIWGKGVVAGVAREMGNPLPDFVFQDMQDSRSEIDNIMAASSAFKGEREGSETKGGRLALIDQSFLRLNELVQVVDYVSYELFNWFYQLAKVRYTEHHYAKTMGKDDAIKVLSIMQDDLEDGTEVKIIPGKTIPEDKQFRYKQAGEDVKAGLLSPVDYFETAGYNNPKELAKNAQLYKLNPSKAVGLTEEQVQEFAPKTAPEEPSQSISFKDLPLDGQIQLAKKAGIILNPDLLIKKEALDVHSKTSPKPQAPVDNKKPQ